MGDDVKDLFKFIEEVAEMPWEQAVVNRDYYQGFMHGVEALRMYGEMCEEGWDLGEFLIRKWLNIEIGEWRGK